jgi:monovalent cation:H+ antiporter-2, CPA2 family
MHHAFFALTLLTLSAAALVWLLQRLKLSPIIGYLTLGVIAGPFQERLFSNPEAANTFSEFGIVLLMFFIGLEFHLDHMRSMLTLCLGGGSLQVVLTSLVAALVAYLLGCGPIASAVIGLMVAFSSTALVLKAFEDRKESDSQRARVSLAVLLLQDFAAILAVVVLPAFSIIHQAQDSRLNPVTQLVLLLIFLPILFVGCRYLLPKLFKQAASARTPEAFSLLSLGACFSVALAAQWAGASLALGAFLGGLVLCQTPFASQILADLNTLRNLALAFFFLTVGMLVDVNYVMANALSLLGALVGVLVLKTLLTSAVLRALRVPTAVAAGVGLSLAQIGEFSFVIGKQAFTLELLPPEPYKFVLALAVFSMMITPFMVSSSAIFGRWLSHSIEEVSEAHNAAPPAGSAPAVHELSPHVPRAIVVGYGPVGRTLARILKDFDIQPVIIDINIDTVNKLNAMGSTAIFGDAGKREILQAAQVDKASYLLVTLPDLAGRIPVVATARVLNPDLKIFVRARYLAERAMLEDSGASAVSYEEAEVAVSLAGFLLKEIGADDLAIEQQARLIRSEIALRSGFSMSMRSPVPKKKQ